MPLQEKVTEYFFFVNLFCDIMDVKEREREREREREPHRNRKRERERHKDKKR